MNKNIIRKIIVALDLTSERKIKEIIASLSPEVKIFKIGLIAYTRFGPRIVDWVKKKGGEVFLDFKLYDIPNTMIKTAGEFTKLGVWGFTVHLKNDIKSLGFLRESLKKGTSPLIVGVSELTSQKTSLKKVLSLAEKAKKCDFDGIVSSVQEAKAIKEKFNLITITPGIRKSICDDQMRVATVKEALDNKVDYLVIGRPIYEADDCRKGLRQLLN